MSDPIELKVHIARDEETDRWYIAQSDIPGLRLEADTADELVSRIVQASPELISLNEKEIVARFEGARRTNGRPPLSVLPIFDSPVQLACA